jgi:hypothetical protein
MEIYVFFIISIFNSCSPLIAYISPAAEDTLYESSRKALLAYPVSLELAKDKFAFELNLDGKYRAVLVDKMKNQDQDFNDDDILICNRERKAINILNIDEAYDQLNDFVTQTRLLWGRESLAAGYTSGLMRGKGAPLDPRYQTASITHHPKGSPFDFAPAGPPKPITPKEVARMFRKFDKLNCGTDPATATDTDTGQEHDRDHLRQQRPSSASAMSSRRKGTNYHRNNGQSPRPESYSSPRFTPHNVDDGDVNANGNVECETNQKSVRPHSANVLSHENDIDLKNDTKVTFFQLADEISRQDYVQDTLSHIRLQPRIPTRPKSSQSRKIPKPVAASYNRQRPSSSGPYGAHSNDMMSSPFI